MNIDWASLSRLVPEAVMVAIVLIFVWKTGKRQDAKDERRDKAFTEAIVSHDKDWRDFMNAERERVADSLSGLTREITVIADLVAATNLLIAQHDAWERMNVERRERA